MPSLEDSKITYLEMTHKLNDYNEIYNVNNYLKYANELELSRLSDVNDTLRTRILRLKQEYLLYDHDIAEYKFRINILYFTAIIVCFVLFITAFFHQGRITPKLAMYLSLGLLIFYLIILLFVVKTNSNRRKYSYDQWYWKPVQRKN